MVSIFFIIFHPLRAKTFLSSRKVHYVHATIILVGILAPAITPLITVLSGISDNTNPEKFGYRVIFYPPQICLSIRKDIKFYAFNLPSNVMLTTGVTFLLLIFWKLYKVRQYV